MIEAIRTGEIFEEEKPDQVDWEVLKKAKSALE
jgi:hypothetical protein